MLELLRKHQYGIMIVVAFLVIIAFAWLMNPYDNRSGKLNQAVGYTIGNRAVTVKEIDRQYNMLRAADELGLNFTMQLLQPTFDAVDFSQNRIILAKEARELGIDPSEEEVNAAIAAHPGFQREGAFSEDTYLDAIENTLKENGMVAGDLRGLMADKIRWERLSALLESNSGVPSSVVDIEFQRERELVTASVVDFKLEDFKQDIEVTDEELQTYYDEQKALVPSLETRAKGRLEAEQTTAIDLIMADEQRKVEFVFVAEPAAPLPPPPVAPGLTPPPLLQPGVGGLQAPPIQIPPIETPPIETIEIPAGDESEPPGQAPPGEEAAPLEEAAALEIEELPAAPDLGELDLKPAEDLNLDVEVGDLTGGAAPALELGGDLNLDTVAPEISALPSGATTTATDSSEFEAKVQAYKKQVDSFYNKVLEAPDQLATLAEADGFEVKSTELFVEDEPPASPIVPAELVAEIFKGSMETDEGLLVPVQGVTPKGFYVARLLEVVESSERSFEDAKEDLREKLIEKKAKEAMEEAVKAASEKFATALEEGKSFADAAAEQELTVRDIDEFSTMKRPTGDNASEIVTAAAKVTTGSVSELVEAGENALLVHVAKRVAASEKKAETVGQPDQPIASDPEADKKNLADRLERQASGGVAGLWLDDRRKQAEIVRADGLPVRPFFPQSLFGGGGFGR
ncbi:MAG: SurA N-terminal domain-containing protein [Verrucomicrobiales bacterium]|nr:SurA N-terminal domain-containing protein [Verrucomicrobiales bacterium]